MTDRPLVLVVDDEPDVCRILEKALSMRGFETRMASSAEEGLAIGVAERPAVVLLDYMMPRMDGLQVLGRLREESPASVVVMVTGQGDERVAARLMKLGAYDYLTKPIDIPRLLRVVREGCMVHRLRSAPDYQRLEEAHRNLLSIHQRLAAVVDALHEGLITYDGDQTVLEANPAAGRLLGVDPRSLVGKSRRAVLPHAVPATRRSEADDGCELQVDLPGGRRIWLMRNSAPIRNDVGEIVGGVETWLETTGIRELHREAIRKEEELARAREALRSKRLLEEKNALLERRLGELGFLNRLGQRLARTVDPKRAARAIADVFRRQFEPACVLCRIRFADGSGTVEAVTSSRGLRLDPAVVPTIRLPLQEGETDAVIGICGLREFPPGAVRDVLVAGGVKGAAFLRTGDCGGLSGEIRILTAEMVCDREMRKVLETATQQIRATLTTMALYQEKERLAITDALTGLYNRKYFNDRLAFEMARSARFGRELSLILIDLDDFKAINDSRGHPVGDRTLSGLGAVLAGTIRKVDLAARYGGEEFAILLPETGKRRAAVSAERIRSAVESGGIVPGGGDGDGLTISAGVATFPVDAETPADLVQQADRALYRAKAAGKNRVTVA